MSSSALVPLSEARAGLVQREPQDRALPHPRRRLAAAAAETWREWRWGFPSTGALSGTPLSVPPLSVSPLPIAERSPASLGDRTSTLRCAGLGIALLFSSCWFLLIFSWYFSVRLMIIGSDACFYSKDYAPCFVGVLSN